MSTGILTSFPAGFDSWPPLAQGFTLFFSTFVLEDLAAVGAGLLLATGALSWPTAFWACFLGIWIGDAGLYALARSVGRPWFERLSRRRFANRVEQSERWLAQRGNSILIFSRLLPGARLPTYLAAGFLRLPLSRFLAITGAASLVWTALVLVLTGVAGLRLLGWLGAFQTSAWTILPGVVLTLALLHFVKKIARPANWTRLRAWVGRWRRWEFWPAWLFYPPVAIYCLWLAVKYRGLTLPAAANPGIFNGGIVGESKMATLRELMATSPEFTAEAELLTGAVPEERLAALREICRRRQIAYPFILKPDVGQRGVGIKLVRSEDQALAYLKQTDAPLIVQRYAEGPHEAGVLYYRFPDEPHGNIFAITEKVFPILTGDGHSSIRELVWSDPRARFMAAKYLGRLNGREDAVLSVGASLKLVEAGNHAQGCIFRDGMHLCTPALAGRIDAISQKLPGFFIGRYDLRYAAEDDLRAGKNFQIIELNGAASEATSIYDARNSLFAAYRTLFRQWDLVFAIGAANRSRGCVATKLAVVWRQWRDYLSLAATYPTAD
ncbi:MAG: VTT domain-containing protein [Verrucomicrobia bacterium]|nr:VTT domain-containing protein [Verrucomicrobiota bacterium]